MLYTQDDMVNDKLYPTDKESPFYTIRQHRGTWLSVSFVNSKGDTLQCVLTVGDNSTQWYNP